MALHVIWYNTVYIIIFRSETLDFLLFEEDMEICMVITMISQTLLQQQNTTKH